MRSRKKEVNLQQKGQSWLGKGNLQSYFIWINKIEIMNYSGWRLTEVRKMRWRPPPITPVLQQKTC